MMENADRAEVIYEAALKALRCGEPVALVTVVQASSSAPRASGAKMLVYPDGHTVGTVGGGASEAWAIDEACKALAAGRPCLLDRPREGQNKRGCDGDMGFFVDVLLPPATLLVIGAGHIAQAVASMGAWLGYRVAVLDERTELVSAERFPEAEILLSGPVDQELREFPITEETYVVLVTPHHSPDEKALSILSERSPAYVGLLAGSRRTRATFRRARDEGVPEAFLRSIHTPVGVDIQAETPREIALSVLAEVTGVRRRES